MSRAGEAAQRPPRPARCFNYKWSTTVVVLTQGAGVHLTSNRLMEGGEEPVSTPTMWEPGATVGDCVRR